MKRLFLAVFTMTALLALLLPLIGATSCSTPPITVVEAYSTCSSVTTGMLFDERSIPVPYTPPMKVYLSSNPQGTGTIVVDDRMRISMYTLTKYDYDFSQGCTSSAPIAPINITSMLNLGDNLVTFQFYDKCGGCVSHQTLYLTYILE